MVVPRDSRLRDRREATSQPKGTEVPQCSYRSPLDGWRCDEPAMGGREHSLCILHDPSPDKSHDGFHAALRRRIERGETWFDGMVCPFPMSFRGQRFTRSTSFHGAQFLAGADFRDVSFGGPTTLFAEAVFSGGEVDFAGCSFNGERADFSGAEFRGDAVSFEQVSFAVKDFLMKETLFDAKRGVAFAGSRFTGERVSFRGAVFQGHAVFFEGVQFSADEVDGSESRFEADLISFEEVTQTRGRLTLVKSVIKGNQVSFAGGRWDGDALLFSRADWKLGHLEFRGAKLGLKSLVCFKAARIEGRSISFSESVFLTPNVDLTWMQLIAKESIRFERIDWEGEIVGNGMRMTAREISFDQAHIGGECFELTSSRLEARQLNAWKASFLCSRFSFSNAVLDVEAVHFLESNFGGNHVYFHRIRWSGDRFLILGTRFASKRLSFNRAVLNGQVFELNDCDLGDCQVSFWETDFADTRAHFGNLAGKECRLKFRAYLKNVHFDTDLDLWCDLSGCVWPGEGFVRRPKLLQEHIAQSPKEWTELENEYRWIARQFERLGRRRRANDFYYSAFECRRKRLAAEGRHVERWKMEFLKWCMGYRLTPSRYTPVAVLFGFLSSLASTVASCWPGHRSG